MTTAISPPPVASPYIEEPLYEVVDGLRVELPPMGARPTEIATILAVNLGTFSKRQKLGRVVVELLFLLDDASKLQRRPDVAFISAARWPLKSPAPDDAAWGVIPDLAIEVVSPTDRAEEAIGKIGEFFRAGVRAAWVVYPKERLVYVYDSFTTIRVLTDPDALDGGEIVPGFHMPLTELFDPS